MPTPPLSYCADLVKRHDRDRFMLSLFVAADAREALLALYALNVELAHVRIAVREEMIGHIRYAWWQETMEKLYAGAAPHGHPTLSALLPLIEAGALPQEAVMPLIESYRTHFPDPPPDADARLAELSQGLLQVLSPASALHWVNAQRIIARHRKRYGAGGNGWLALRLLLAGWGF